VQERTKKEIPFWVVAAGGKYDFTAKWWSSSRYQQVVDYFAGKIQFVQVGELHHYHPPLRGVIDLRGLTDTRQLVRLVYHSQGVLCGVTFLMHLAAAVETRGRKELTRPCVVVAGGREPPQWEAYPRHQFLHTVGALPCCERGGCWKSRTLPLGDGSEKDLPRNLCVNVVHGMPRCMDMISVEDVISSIEIYFEGGRCDYLTAAQFAAAQTVVRQPVASEFVT
jgi:ADP-heptose:LPS heptosyltransferase